MARAHFLPSRACNCRCRDIKPENVFLHSAGILLGDWGLGIDNVQERPVSRVGTLDYMAPEVLSAPSIPPGVNFRVPAGSDEPGSYDPSVRCVALIHGSDTQQGRLCGSVA